jgi:hypothetical protein
MMHPLKIATLSCLTSALLLANPYQSSEEDVASVIETGNKASMKLIKALGGELQKHMKSEGPAGAVRYCAENAFPLTRNIDDELGEGISIKRVSLKERNPSNTPEADERAVLESLQTLNETHVDLPPHVLERVDAETYKFYKPLVINKPVCLKCHGTVENQELADYIKKMYPGDKATGYKLGDLRGVIVVTIKK